MNYPTQPLKNPGVAAVLSAVFPGLGQIYNGQIAQAILFMVIYAISIAAMFVVIGLVTTPVLWILGIADAYREANKINQRITQNA